ncbi:MAG: signal peptide peptidase SppA [Kiritimatiellae bacterium]|nr:signal peptide peptidase SppA [Kiritimatiellia bacterium]
MEDPAYQTTAATSATPPVKSPCRLRLGGCLFGASAGCLFSLMMILAIPFLFIYVLGKSVSEAIPHTQCDPVSTEALVDDGMIPVQRLELRGVITGAWSSPWYVDPTSDVAVLQQIEAAIDEEGVKGLLLVVNSPGGSVTASDNLYHALERFKAAQPGRKVFVIGGDLVASGAYYLAMQADWLRVQPTSVVGSIGVILPGLNIATLAQRLGIADNSIASGASKDIGNPLKPVDPAHNAVLKTVVDGMYARFTDLVAKGRKMEIGKVRSLADGRVFTAEDAKRCGLVDDIGYEDTMTAKIAELFGCKSEEVYLYSPTENKTSFRYWINAFPQAIGRGLSEGLMPVDSKMPQYRW